MKLTQLALICSAAIALSTPLVFADIHVGVSLSTTGPGAALGIPEKNALAMMPTDIAGEKINYIVLDDATDPTAATKNARKLTSEDRELLTEQILHGDLDNALMDVVEGGKNAFKGFDVFGDKQVGGDGRVHPAVIEPFFTHQFRLLL